MSVMPVLEKPDRTEPELLFRYRWPGEGPSGECDNFFLGIWHPHRHIRVEWPPSLSPTTVHLQGSNWFLASASSPLHRPGTGLVQRSSDSSSAVAFRGYVVSPRIHSYSPRHEILNYWENHLFAQHNGVFSAAVIGRNGESLALVTDLFGMGPLYYRTMGDVIAFSTSPRYLATAGDDPDLLAWRCLLHTGFTPADRSLSLPIRRLPGGKVFCLSREGRRMVSWFDFHSLPGGTRPVTSTSVGAVEKAFQQAMDRCLQLENRSIVLPLSSGHDSRRILAAMIHRRVDFRAYTCRVFQKQHRDLDARFAAEMAWDLGFSHTIIEPSSPEEYAADDRARRVLVDAETNEHTWVFPLMRSLPRHPSLFFDGIAGDVLGSPVGWSVVFGLRDVCRSPEDEIEAIANQCITDVFNSLIHPGRWPTLQEVREDIKTYLKALLPRRNLDEIAFLFLRQRRSTSLWSQHLLPAGHVVVCPYLDLDYLRVILDFNPADKRATVFQRRCLKDFWPQYSRYSGNRDIPDDLPPGAPEFENKRILHCHERLREEIEASQGMHLLSGSLSAKGRLALELSKRRQAIALRTSWFLNPLMELVSRQVRANDCWESTWRTS